MLVDAGRENKWKSLGNRLEKLGVTADSLAGLILTHSHFDHAENAAAIKAKFKTKIVIHREEADHLMRGENPLIHGTTIVTGLMTDLVGEKLLLPCLRYQPASVDIQVDERYDLQGLGFDGFIIHTPGHSPGSMSVVVGNEIAIVGDAMFGVFKESVFPPFADDAKLMVKSWEALLQTGCSLFLPAHGWERSRELLQRQYEKYSRVYDFARSEPDSPGEQNSF